MGCVAGTLLVGVVLTVCNASGQEGDVWIAGTDKQPWMIHNGAKVKACVSKVPIEYGAGGSLRLVGPISYAPCDVP